MEVETCLCSGSRKCKSCKAKAHREYSKNYYRRHRTKILRQLREKYGAVKRDASSGPIEQLTPMELAVVKELLAGYTTGKAIADHLVISAKTVQTHLSNVFYKWHVSSAIDVVLVAISEGMEIKTNWQQLREKRGGA